MAKLVRPAALVSEQLALSLLQLSPSLAALMTAGSGSLAWTASVSIGTGLCYATLRGSVIQPFVLLDDQAGYIPGRRLAIWAASAVAVFGLLGLLGAFRSSGALIGLALAAPGIAVAELGRAIQDEAHVVLAWSAWVGLSAAVALVVQVAFYAELEPLGVSLVWAAAWWVAALPVLVVHRQRFRWSSSPGMTGPTRLTLPNLLGQLVALGPLMLLAAFASEAAVSAIQSARIVQRPIVVLAAAMPVRYLKHLRSSDSVKVADRANRRVVAATAIASLTIGIVVLVARPLLASLGDLSVMLYLIVAVATVVAVWEVAVSLTAYAVDRDEAVLRARLTALAVVVAIGALLLSPLSVGDSPELLALTLTAPPLVAAAMVKVKCP